MKFNLTNKIPVFCNYNLKKNPVGPVDGRKIKILQQKSTRIWCKILSEWRNPTELWGSKGFAKNKRRVNTSINFNTINSEIWSRFYCPLSPQFIVFINARYYIVMITETFQNIIPKQTEQPYSCLFLHYNLQDVAGSGIRKFKLKMVWVFNSFVKLKWKLTN